MYHLGGKYLTWNLNGSRTNAPSFGFRPHSTLLSSAVGMVDGGWWRFWCLVWSFRFRWMLVFVLFCLVFKEADECYVMLWWISLSCFGICRCYEQYLCYYLVLCEKKIPYLHNIYVMSKSNLKIVISNNINIMINGPPR